MERPRAIIHADLDQFYAAVEVLDRPELAGRPVIVGSDPQGGRGRGVVSTASYEAREFGVHSALPISQAFKRCPQGVYLRPRMGRYVEISRRVMEIFRHFTPEVEPLSLDEAFLEVTGSRRLFGDPPTIARALRREIWRRERLVVSIGVAACKSVAKIASDLEKPAGLVIVPRGAEIEFLAPLPIRRLWGVGPKAAELLEQLGIRKVADLYAVDPALLRRRLGSAHAEHFLALGRGEDPRRVEGGIEAKSVGHELTFDVDVADHEEIERTLLMLADHVGRRLRRLGLRGRTVQLKLRWSDFSTLTRADTHDPATESTLDIFHRARAKLRPLLARHPNRAVRLIGVSLTGFGEHPQRELFADPAEADSELDRAADQIRDRFGEAAILPARLVDSPERGDSG